MYVCHNGVPVSVVDVVVATGQNHAHKIAATNVQYCMYICWLHSHAVFVCE